MLKRVLDEKYTKEIKCRFKELVLLTKIRQDKGLDGSVRTMSGNLSVTILTSTSQTLENNKLYQIGARIAWD